MKRRGEFKLIDEIFAPLATGCEGALGLKDDAALLSHKLGYQLVLTVDALVAGVHFIGDEPPGKIAQKLLRVNLSDLAAMGAEAIGYLLTLALPAELDDDWLAGFAEGLRRDQQAFGISLMGGDTVFTSGPLTLSLTVIGSAPSDEVLLRSTVEVGDELYVSGYLGDAALGLKVVQGDIGPEMSEDDKAYLIDRYQLPQPRLALGRRLIGLAHSAMDVSDGLVADLEHMARASDVSLRIEVNQVALSPAVRRRVAQAPDVIETVLTGGDDYELAFCAPASSRRVIKALASEIGIPLSRIGRAEKGQGVYLYDQSGDEVTLSTTGWTHF